MKTEDLLKDLLQLPKLHLRVHTLADGLLQGEHQSPFKGFNVEFAEHRAYLPGDELKYVDWKVLAKTDRLYVKHYEEETNLHASCWLDTSASMHFTSHLITKWEMASLLAATFSYLLLQQNDHVATAMIQDPPKQLPAGSHMGYFRNICDFLEKPPENPGQTDLVQGLGKLLAGIRRRGIVMIFSDFYVEPDALTGVMRTLSAQNMDVALFHLLDPVELGLTLEGQWRFEDMETDAHLALSPGMLRGAYAQELNEHTRALSRLCRDQGTSYHLVDTSRHPVGVCLEVLKQHGLARL